MFSLIVPLPPIVLSIVGEFEHKQNITVTLEWDQPNGTGAEFFIESYSISLSPQLEVYTYIFMKTLNVTLDYNVNYTAAVVSVNCAGESSPILLHNLLFSKLILKDLASLLQKQF